AVLAGALPHDDEVPRAVHRDGRRVLVAGREGVDLEVLSGFHTGTGETLPYDAVIEGTLPAAVLVALPDHDEISCVGLTDGGIALIVSRVGIGPELGARDGSGSGVTLCEDAAVGAVLARAGIRRSATAVPGHDEVARAVAVHGRISLIVRRVGIH